MPRRSTTAATASSKRKYELTLADGQAVDLDTIDPNANPSPAVITALKERIKQLEDEAAAKPAINEQPDTASPPAKRARTSTTATDANDVTVGAPPAVTSAAAAKEKQKKHKKQLKLLFDRLKKECKAPSVRFQGDSKTIKFEEVFTQEEFAALFRPGEIGTLIQPRPDNKPTSTVTVIEFTSQEEIKQLFGSELKQLKGTRWSKGENFARSVKLGQVDVEPLTLHASYSSNGMKLTLKFEVDIVYGPGDMSEKLVPGLGRPQWVTISKDENPSWFM